MAADIFGNFEENLPPSREYLTIGFSPASQPLKHRWENNGVSADFIADYFRNFYISKKEHDGNTVAADEVENLRDAVKYISNELLENAMKFQSAEIPSVATISFSLYSGRLVFSIQNGLTFEQAKRFKTHIHTMLSSDPMTLYLETMRDSVLEENHNRSGLGLLSMVCDYSAKLGWKFEPHDTKADLLTVTTMVCLDT